LEDLPGALWNRGVIEACRASQPPRELVRVVVAIDPAGRATETANETGIVVAGKSPFTYVVLRYRHDPLAAEFANVGVVLHQPASGFLNAKLRHTSGRISRIFPDLDGDALRSSLRDIERAIRRIARSEAGDLLRSLSDAAAVARRVLPEDDTSFIWGPLG